MKPNVDHRALVLGLLAVCVYSSFGASFEARHKELFEDFKVRYRRNYKGQLEETKRLGVFLENMREIDRLNELNGKPVFGVTKFADKSRDELPWNIKYPKDSKLRSSIHVKQHTKNIEWNSKNNAYHKILQSRTSKYLDSENTSPKRMLIDDANKNNNLTLTEGGSPPSYLNWELYGKVTPVKSQGPCNAGWAFTVAQAVETAWLMQDNAMWEFSPQQILSCTKQGPAPLSQGCGGGDQIQAYEYLKNLTNTDLSGYLGLGSAAFAPYVQSMYSMCDKPRCTMACSEINVDLLLQDTGSYVGYTGRISDYSFAIPPCQSGDCASQDLSNLQSVIASVGPLSIMVNAENWHLYSPSDSGDVLSAAACGSSNAESSFHGAQLVGYNTQVSPPYWIVRNSFATDWGVDGYIYLEMSTGTNTCGLGNEVTYVTLDKA